jgi:hypothetical protein
LSLILSLILSMVLPVGVLFDAVNYSLPGPSNPYRQTLVYNIMGPGPIGK